jgi:hypothetical protein
MESLVVLCFRRFYRNSERADPGLQGNQVGAQLWRGDTPDNLVERAFEPLEDRCEETSLKQHRARLLLMTVCRRFPFAREGFRSSA